jgi:hypothetical protein
MLRQIIKLVTTRAGGQIVKQFITPKISVRAEVFSLQNGVFGGFFSA